MLRVYSHFYNTIDSFFPLAYFYKQVPQNADNPQQDHSPEGDEIPPDQAFKNNDQDAGKLSEKRVVSDGKREWSEILQELKAEKERNEREGSSPDDINVLEKGDLHDSDLTRGQSPLDRWRAAFKKLKLMKTDIEPGDEGTSVTKQDVLTTLPEKREELTSEHPSTASETNLGTSKEATKKPSEKSAYIDSVQAQDHCPKIVQKIDKVEQNEKTSQAEGNKHFFSDDVEAKEQWEKILRTLSEQAEETSCPSYQDQRPSSDISQESKKSNLPELLQELRTAKSEEQPELLRHRSAKTGRKKVQTDLPEIVQDSTTTAKGIEKSKSVTTEDDGKSSSSIERTSQQEDHGTVSREPRDSESHDPQNDQPDNQDEQLQKHSKPDEND